MKIKDIGIRPFESKDVAPFYDAAIESFEHMHEFMPWCHSKYSMQESRDWVESRKISVKNNNEHSFIIYSKEDNELLGGVELNQINQAHQIGNLGYWVRKKALKRGVATRATLLLASYGFNTMGLTRLEITTLVNNIPSRKVAENTGAKYEGILQNRLVLNGTPVDACMFSLINP